jgi:hypothetical protein
VLAYCAGPWLIVILAIPTLYPEFYYGQINLFLISASLVGFRWPAAWAFVLLTKVTPGVGLLWFVCRSEWRHLAIALGVTAAVAGVSLALAPNLWVEWIGVLLNNARTPMPELYIPVPLWQRLIAAALLLAWAAPRGHRWAVPITVTLGTAWLGWPHLVMLVGVMPLARPAAKSVVARWLRRLRSGSD